MKKIIIESLTIISQKELKARKIEFDPKITVLKSQREDEVSLNRTGKSLVLKSIYYAFGAELSRYTTNWENLKLCTIIKFKLDCKKFEIFRNGNTFLVFDECRNFKKFYSIKDLKEFYVELFSFNIKLIESHGKKTKTSYLYPGAVFLPFYIDQDVGWNGDWKSFKDINFYRNWKKEILLYHTGVKSKRYYEILEEQAEYEEKNKFNKIKLDTLESIFNEQLERNKDVLDINITLDEFVEEIHQLTNELNKQLNLKNNKREILLNLYNEKYEAEENYKNAVNALKDMESDIEYLNSNFSEEQIKCPVCGVTHKNDIANRFKMYQEIEQCRRFINDYLQKKEILQKSISKYEEELTQLNDEVEKINSILTRKRNDITFEEVLKSRGAKSLIDSIINDITKLGVNIDIINGKLKAITSEKTRITKEGRAIQQEYFRLLSVNLSELGVCDVELTGKEKIGDMIKSGGSDLSRTVLAELYAYYYLVGKYSSSIICPMVIDTPLQQDQGSENIDLIFNFIIDKQPENSQIIIATTETQDKEVNGKVYNLLDSLSLLREQDYQECKYDLDKFLKMLIV